MTDPPKHKLRWYQYSLSSLFILTTLVALACSWYANEMFKATERRKAIAEIEELGGYVWYYEASNPYTLGEPPRWYSWLRKLHGDEYLGNAAGVGLHDTQTTDAGLLKHLTKLEALVFRGRQITDAGLENLKDLTNLRRLRLGGTQITDAGLVHLKGLTNLEHLWLTDTQVSDEGVKKLEEALPNCDISH